jgi:hypothetical protein
VRQLFSRTPRERWKELELFPALIFSVIFKNAVFRGTILGCRNPVVDVTLQGNGYLQVEV